MSEISGQPPRPRLDGTPSVIAPRPATDVSDMVAFVAEHLREARQVGEQHPTEFKSHVDGAVGGLRAMMDRLDRAILESEIGSNVQAARTDGTKPVLTFRGGEVVTFTTRARELQRVADRDTWHAVNTLANQLKFSPTASNVEALMIGLKLLTDP